MESGKQEDIREKIWGELNAKCNMACINHDNGFWRLAMDVCPELVKEYQAAKLDAQKQVMGTKYEGLFDNPY